MFELKNTYLNSAYMGPMPIAAKKRVEKFLNEALDPSFSNFEERAKIIDEIRNKFGRLIGVDGSNVALGGSVGEFVAHVANGMDLRPGDDVLLMDGDYPSMILPWMVAAERTGFTVKLLPRLKFLDPSALEKEIGERTRFAGCSHVMFNTGIPLPVVEIGRICRRKSVLFMSDVSQSLGATRLPAQAAANVDIIAGVAYKWLLGPYGTSFAYFSDSALEQVRRTHANWSASANMVSTESLLNYTTAALPGARKFDRGETSVYLLNHALDAALETILSAGLEDIERNNLALAREFLAGLPPGFESYSTPEAVTPIVCVKNARHDSVRLKKLLAQNGIDVSLREGYLRFSFHLFNSAKDVRKALEILKI